MTGPVVEVLLRTHHSPGQALALVTDAARNIGLAVEPPDQDEQEAIASVPLPGGHRLSIWLAAPHQDDTPAEAAFVDQHLGYQAATALQVVSWTRNPTTARIQAGLLIQLADLADDAAIRLDGPLGPPGFRRTGDFEASASAVRRYVRHRPGVLLETPYTVWDESIWIYHIVDSRFLGSWLDDPDFYLPN